MLKLSESGQGGEDGQPGDRLKILGKGRVDHKVSFPKVYVTDIAGMHDFYVLRVKDMPAFRR